MKRAIKIIAYCVWFGFILWLSTYSGGFFFELVSSIEKRIIRSEIPPDYDPEINLVLWNGFICLLVWIPILLTRKRRADAIRTIGRDITFLILLSGFMVGGAVIWQIDFSDDFTPSLFINVPDTIKEGWSPFELWCVWWAFIIVSNAFSAVVAFVIWRPSNRKPTIL
jgi:hypothetical protein